MKDNSGFSDARSQIRLFILPPFSSYLCFIRVSSVAPLYPSTRRVMRRRIGARS